MNCTELAYIKLISGCINKSYVSIELDEIDYEQLIELCRIHSNVGIVYSSLKNISGIPKHYIDAFEQGFYTEMMIYSKRTSIFNMLTKQLAKRNVKHIIIKGKSIAELYPQEELRTMGDIDIVVDSKDMAAVKTIIEEAGGESIFDKSNEYVLFCKLNRINVEVHSRIAYKENMSGQYDYEKYFEDIFEHIQDYDRNTYILEPQYNMIYSIFHAAKHFYYHGCGVRMITDIAVMYNSYRNILDMTELYKQLDCIGLKQFAKKIFALCNRWFETKIDGVSNEFDNIETIENYILSGGVYGYGNVDSDTGKIRKRDGNNRVKAIIKWAFPSYKEMRQCSSWFSEKPAILLPIAYVERFVRNARKRGGIGQWIKKLLKGKQTNKIHSDILNIMELD